MKKYILLWAMLASTCVCSAAGPFTHVELNVNFWDDMFTTSIDGNFPITPIITGQTGDWTLHFDPGQLHFNYPTYVVLRDPNEPPFGNPGLITLFYLAAVDPAANTIEFTLMGQDRPGDPNALIPSRTILFFEGAFAPASGINNDLPPLDLSLSIEPPTRASVPDNAAPVALLMGIPLLGLSAFRRVLHGDHLKS